MKPFSQVLKKHYRTIIEIATLVGVFIALFQLNLQKEQFVFEKSQRSFLEFSYDLRVADIDTELVTKTSQDLQQLLYTKLYENTKVDTTPDYIKEIDTILPLSEKLPARPVALQVNVTNKGAGTATKVRVFIDLDYAITSISIDSLEPYRILNGGVDSKAVSIEIDRMASGSAITITIMAKELKSKDIADELILDNSPFEVQSSYRSQVYIAFLIDNSGSLYPNLPTFRYMSANRENLKVKSIQVTSDDGTAYEAEKVIP